jgi:hypothetical protein
VLPQVLKGAIDFKSEPWPKISEAAKDCVKKLLEMDPAKRATSEQVGWPAWFCSDSSDAAPRMQTLNHDSQFSRVCLFMRLQILKREWLVKEGVCCDPEPQLAGSQLSVYCVPGCCCRS